MKKFQCLLWAVGATTASVYAQNPSDSTRLTELDEVVVTDTRSPIRRVQSGKTVIRLDARALASFKGGSVADVLNRQAGFEIGGGRGRPGEVLGVYARGGRGRQVLVLIDGIRVNDPSSFSQEYDLRLLPLDQVASIEIIKGASSTLYGTNAATAVIDIRTRKEENRPLAVHLSGSLATHRAVENDPFTFGRYTSYVGLGGTSGTLTYQAGLSHQRAEGLSALVTEADEKDPYRNLSVNARLGWQATERLTLEIFADRTRMKAAYDDAFAGADAPFQYLTDQERLGGRFRYTTPGYSLEGHAAYAAYNSEDQSQFPATYRGGNWEAEAVLRKPLGDRATVLAGLRMLRDRADLEQPESFTQTDPFVHIQWSSALGLNLSAGARLNLHSAYGSQWVYQLNPSWAWRTPSGYVKALASWSTAYITPSLQQLYGAFGANPELEPERNQTLETGLEGRSQQWRWSLLYFNRKEQQSVVFDNASFVFFNATDPIRVSGIEAEVHWQPAEQWDLSANYTFTERQGDAAIRIPRHKFNARASVRLGKAWTTTLAYSFTGPRPDTDFVRMEQVELAAFSLWDARLTYSPNPQKWEMFLAVANLFDTEFTEVLGYQAPGRTLQLGGRVRL